MIKVYPDDFNQEMLARAHMGTSFTPEKRAEDLAASLAEFFNKRVEELMLSIPNLSVSQDRYLNDTLPTTKEKYLSLCNEYIAAKARVLSPMITGPARFPVERNRKRLETESRRFDAMVHLTDKMFARHKTMLKKMNSAEQEEAALYDSLVKYGINAFESYKCLLKMNVANVSEWINGVNAYYKTKLRNLKNPELITRVIDAVENIVHLEQPQLQLFKEKSGIRKLLREYLPEEEKEDDDPNGVGRELLRIYNDATEKVAEFDIKLWEDKFWSRTKLEFHPTFWKTLSERKLDMKVKDILKHSAWRWSPQAQCWMRKMTDNAWNNGNYVMNSIAKIVEV